MIREITETVAILFISAIFLSLFLTTTKIQSKKEKMIKEKLMEAGERFEVLITKPKCLIGDQEIKIQIGKKEFICGKGIIEKAKEL